MREKGNEMFFTHFSKHFSKTVPKMVSHLYVQCSIILYISLFKEDPV